VILCVDNAKLSLVVRKLVLEDAGYEVITATKAEQALVFLSAKDIRLVICDHMLGEIKGTTLAARIKATKPDLPILLLSGSIEAPSKPEHVDIFVSKLEGPEVLLANVLKILPCGA
jgi:CheY-like chemotaxis protein